MKVRITETMVVLALVALVCVFPPVGGFDRLAVWRPYRVQPASWPDQQSLVRHKAGGDVEYLGHIPGDRGGADVYSDSQGKWWLSGGNLIVTQAEPGWPAAELIPVVEAAARGERIPQPREN